jgi:hypothetical protein
MLLAMVSLAAAFACYQGVVTTFTVAMTTTIGMRLALAADPRREWSRVVGDYAPRLALLGVSGVALYLAMTKLTQLVIPHVEWSSGYKVALALPFADGERLYDIARTIFYRLGGKWAADLPFLSVLLFVLVCAAVAVAILRMRPYAWWQRFVLIALFGLSIGVFPFGILFVSDAPVASRAVVGLGLLYGFVFAVLAVKAGPRLRRILYGVAGLWVFQFIFLGNEMYYAQHLLQKAEHTTIARVLSRIDMVAASSPVEHHVPVVMVGQYFPANKRHLRFETLGQSAFYWDDGVPERQLKLIELYGGDGLEMISSLEVTEEAAHYIDSNAIPAWPQAGSVFLFRDKFVVINWGK